MATVETVTINASGIGAAQSGNIATNAGGTAGVIMVCNDTDSPLTFDVKTGATTVLSDQYIAAKSFSRVTGLGNGNQTLHNVKTAHGTAAQVNEKVYVLQASA
tara:strand:- start:2793 stop:3101 length:309 start_codon:yes stop_codon:yes gene_type:complete